MNNLPTIRIHYNSMKFYELFIDGKKKDFIYGSSKKFMERYLKRNYDIDLRTDKRIIKNYKEYTIRLVKESGGVKTYVKKLL